MTGPSVFASGGKVIGLKSLGFLVTSGAFKMAP
ncbi:MAG: hypothetical protein JWP96_538 [Polaromonas sp.]|nr:hypothetical protein [Polaromonas sp.]